MISSRMISFQMVMVKSHQVLHPFLTLSSLGDRGAEARKRAKFKMSVKFLKQLAIWANKQQRMRREHKLGEVREEKLKQLGFDFSHKNNSFVAAWEQHYVELLRFKQDWGHCTR